MKTIIKVIVAVLLLLCLADMPYGFYQIVRFAATAAFVYLSYDYFKCNKDCMGFFFAALALLFQPFFKIALGRTIWNVVDVIVAMALFYIIVKALKRNN